MTDRLTSSTQGIIGSHMMIEGALSRLNDADLAFSPGGDNVTLGEIFKSFGDIQDSYNQSLKTFKQDWSKSADNPEVTTNLDSLKAWFKQLAGEMRETLQSLTENDLQKPIDRGNNVIRTLDEQLEIYIQALMIFFGKLVIYFRAMSKDLPPSIEQYIA